MLQHAAEEREARLTNQLAFRSVGRCLRFDNLSSGHLYYYQLADIEAEIVG